MFNNEMNNSYAPKIPPSPTKIRRKLTVAESLQRTFLESRKPWCRNVYESMMKKARKSAKNGNVCMEYCQDRTKKISEIELENLIHYLPRRA